MPLSPRKAGWRGRVTQRHLDARPTTEIDDATLSRVVAETYVGSLDFPELNGTRSMAEVLAGHRAAGRHRPEDWRVVADAHGDPAGVLLLAQLEPLGLWELSYLGVLPRARRQGWGRRMVAEAVRHVRDEGHGEQLEVAVDARNIPALQLYAAAGFRKVARALGFPAFPA